MADSPEVSVACELDLSDRYLKAPEAKRIEKALRAALKQVLPDHRIRGLWIHSKPKSG